jgi:hypothetical protein
MIFDPIPRAVGAKLDPGPEIVEAKRHAIASALNAPFVASCDAKGRFPQTVKFFAGCPHNNAMTRFHTVSQISLG